MMFKRLFLCFLSLKNVDLGLLILRVTIGIIFMAHGAQKLFGWFDGAGFAATVDSMQARGLTPALLMAILAVGTEFFGALFLALGFLTRLAAFLLVIFMVVAAKVSHWEHGFFILNNGYEYTLALGIASLTFLITGAGAISIDKCIENALRKKWHAPLK
jgi:putative oxidoreductase